MIELNDHRSRIVPIGGRNDPVSEIGIRHYVQFVDDLLEAGITPVVTLFHWDVPDGIDKRYGGLLNKEEFVKDYEKLCTYNVPSIVQGQALDHFQRALLQFSAGL